MPSGTTKYIQLSRIAIPVAAIFIAVILVVIGASPAAAQAGNCMEDIVQQLDGSNAVPLNCTANDVRVSRYNVLAGPSSCIDGENVTVLLEAQMVAGASERYDIGLFVALDGGDALRGSCYEDYLNPPLSATQTPAGLTRTSPFYNAEASEDPGDTCGDIEQGVTTLKQLQTITISCRDSNSDGFVDVGSCVSWDNAKSAGTNNKPSCTSATQTRPNNKSKCRCEAVQVGNIVFLRSARLEVIKDIVPNLTQSSFDLTITGSDAISTFNRTVTGVGDLGSTGVLTIPAGTNIAPGGRYTITESASNGTNLADFNSAVSCVRRGTGQSIGSDSGPGPFGFDVAPGDDIVCTFTNTYNKGALSVVKNVVPDDPATNWVISSGGPSAFGGTISGDGTVGPNLVLVGTYNITETAGANTDLNNYVSTWQCTNGANTTSGTGTSLQLAIGPVENWTCTFTNTRKPGALEVTKTADPTSLPETGGTVVYTISVANPSLFTPITLQTLSDDRFGDLNGLGNCSVPQTIAAGGTYTCAFTQALAGPANTQHRNVVTASGTDGQTPLSDTDDAVVTFTDVPPTVQIDKVATPTTRDEPGGVFTYTLTIQNTSGVSGTITALTDTYPIGAQCQALIGTVLIPQQIVSCEYQVTHVDAGQYDNLAVVRLVDVDGTFDEDDDPETVYVQNVPPTVELIKTADPGNLPEPGGVFTYTLTINNTSAEPVTITTLTDTHTLSTQCTQLQGTVLPVNGTTSCTYQVTYTDAGTYPNTAGVVVVDNEGSQANDTDGESVTVTDVLPTVNLTKSANPTSRPEPGGVFTYTLTIQNTSPEAVTITALTDSNTLSAACTQLVGTSLAAGASTSCQYTVTHTDAGSYPNTASVTVRDNENNTASDTKNETVEVTDVMPTVRLTKAATPTSLPEPGGVFSYTLTIENSSAEAVTITALTDTNALSGQCLALINTSLAVGASTSCEYTVTRTNAGTYPNTADVTVQDNEGNPASDTAQQSVTVVDVLPSVTLDKVATPTFLPEPGGVFTYTLTIQNNSVEIVNITNLTDTQTLSQECLDLIGDPIQPGASASCQYQVTRTNAGTYPNTAAVVVADDDNNTERATDDETVTVGDQPPTVRLTKTATPATLAEPGGVFTFTLTIENTSPEVVNITTLTDTQTLSQQCSDLIGDQLAIGQIVSCEYTVTHTEAGTYDNTARVTVQDNEGSSGSDEDSATVTVTNTPPTVDLVKSADPQTLPEPGGVFTFTLTITNTSSEAVTITRLTDTQLLSAECQNLALTQLAAGASTSCTYTTTHVEAGSYPNTASVTVEDNEGSSDTSSDDEIVTVTDTSPTVDLVKTADPQTLPEPGGIFTYTLTITNTSSEAVTITQLIDSNALSAQCIALRNTQLAAGAATSCQYTVTHVDAGSYPNTASVTVEDNETNSASDSDTATVNVTNVPPTVEIVKTADPTSLMEPGGVFTFTLTIQNTSPEAVEITALTDTYALSQACLALIGTTIPANDMVSCSYQVTHTDAGLYGNTASVTVRDNEQDTATDSDDEQVEVLDKQPTVQLTKVADPTSRLEPGGVFTFTLTILNTASEPVTITNLTDTYALSAECLALINTQLAVGGSKSCSYQVTHADAGQYQNTAVVTVTDNEGNPASDDDPEMVEVTDVLPTVELVKSADPALLSEPGGIFTYTLSIKNTSVETVTITALTDNYQLSPQCLALIGTTLDPEATTTCQYQVMHTEAGTYDNQAEVTVRDNENNSAGDTDNESVQVVDVLPTVELVKEAAPSSLVEPGGSFVFTLTVYNRSVEPVIITALTDSYPLSQQCQALIGTTLLVGGSTQCQYSVTHTEAGTYDNTAVVTVQDNEQNSSQDNDTATVRVIDALPSVVVAKTANPVTLPEPGGLATFDVNVQNTSAEAVNLTSLIDVPYGDLLDDANNALISNSACVASTIPAGQSYSCSFQASVTGGPGVYTDTVTATVVDNEQNSAKGSDDATVTLTDAPASIAVTKTASVTSLPYPGGLVTFTIAAQNTSAVDAVTLDTITDTVYGDVTQVTGNMVATTCAVPHNLAAGETYTCTFTANITVPANATADLVENNVVTVRGTSDDGEDIEGSDDETVTVIVAPKATIGDRVFVDINPDGTNSAEKVAGNQKQDYDASSQPVESNVAGIDVLLFAADGTLIAQTQTDANGDYQFTDVPPGDYYVVFVNDNVYMGAWTSYNAQIADDVNSDVDPTLPLDAPVQTVIDNLFGPGADAVRTPTFTIQPGQTYLDVDAGLIDLSGAGSVDISGLVWFDVNRDGIRQPDEVQRVPGILVELYKVDSSQPNGIAKVDSMSTLTDGSYAFTGLDAGVYFIKVTAPNNRISPQDAGSDDNVDSDVDPQTGESQPVLLNGDVVTLDIGVHQIPTALDPGDEPSVGTARLYLPAVQR